MLLLGTNCGRSSFSLLPSHNRLQPAAKCGGGIGLDLAQRKSSSPSSEGPQCAEDDSFTTRSRAKGGKGAARALENYLESAGIPSSTGVVDKLLVEFGSVGAVVSGSWWRLRRLAGADSATVIVAARKLLHATLLENVTERPMVEPREIARFIQFSFGSLTRERLVAIYVDEKRRFLSIEKIADGSISDVRVNVTAILHRGLDVGAAGFFLVHNHPSGDPTPSEADVLVTQRLGWIAQELRMTLIEHLVVSQNGISSVTWS